MWMDVPKKAHQRLYQSAKERYPSIDTTGSISESTSRNEILTNVDMLYLPARQSPARAYPMTAEPTTAPPTANTANANRTSKENVTRERFSFGLLRLPFQKIRLGGYSTWWCTVLSGKGAGGKCGMCGSLTGPARENGVRYIFAMADLALCLSSWRGGNVRLKKA